MLTQDGVMLSGKPNQYFEPLEISSLGRRNANENEKQLFLVPRVLSSTTGK